MTESHNDQRPETALELTTKGAVTHVHLDKIDDRSPRVSTAFRGRNAKRSPTVKQMVPHTAPADFVIDGWAPKAPYIDSKTKITAFGSCFAANISRWLGRRNYRVSTTDEDAQNAYVVRIGEGMVNSFVIRQQFEWAWENKTYEEALWHSSDKQALDYDEDVRLETKQLFDGTDLFILTFGLSEVWYDSVTDNVFWRAVPKEHFDPERHKFRVSTVEENRENLEAIYQLIRKHRPEARIIFTLSPIPLIATFRDESCMTANWVSKSILRVAIDEVMRAHKAEGYLHYWPSYELVLDVFRAPFMDDRRHIDTKILDFIMTQFEHVWCKAEDNQIPSLLEAWVVACAKAGLLPARIGRMAERRSAQDLRDFVSRPQFDRIENAEEAKAMLLALADEWEAGRN